MRFPLLLLFGGVIAAPGSTHAQDLRARSLDYLFASGIDDARALWVNPAGLGAVLEASVMAEAVFDRPPGGDVRVSQWSAGFNARGFSVGYLRQRLESDVANQEFRFGLGRGTRRGAVGVSFSLYKSDQTDPAWDIGLRYRLMPALELGVVVRNIGQPELRQEKLPATGVAGLQWAPVRRVLAISGEVVAQNRILASGLDVTYRTGGRLSVGGQLPLTALVALELDDDLNVSRWTLGIAIGAGRRGIAVASLPAATAPERDRFSVTGLATNR